MIENNRRIAQRVKVDVYGRLHSRQAKLVGIMPYICKLLDISETGVRFSTNMKFDVGDEFTLVVNHFDTLVGTTLYGEVIWKKQVQGLEYVYGARLFTQNYENSKELKQCVDNMLREDV